MVNIKTAVTTIIISIIVLLYPTTQNNATNITPCKTPIQVIEQDYNALQTILNTYDMDYTFRHVGVYKITAYCGCSKCCGKWASTRKNGVVTTANGSVAIQGKTVACNGFNFGTRLLIGGNVYTVTDRTASNLVKTVDVYFDNHNDALNFGCKYLDVFVIQD